MPIYEFKCMNCDKIFDVIAPFDESHIKTRLCPDCGDLSNRIPSRFFGSVANQELKELASRGIIPVEQGMKKDVERVKEEKKKKHQNNIRKVVENTVMQFDIPGGD